MCSFRGRLVLALVLVGGLGGVSACDSGPPAPQSSAERADAAAHPSRAATAARLRRLEARFGSRLGVYALDTGSGREVRYRAEERFPYASTFKAFLAGAVLRKYGLDGLGRAVPVRRLDNSYSPVTQRRVGANMTLAELAAATVRYSDNTAANLLLDHLGGPQGLDAVLAGLGDDVIRIERREPALNDWAPGQMRDTSTPRAMADSLRAFVLGDVLGTRERALLTRWLRTNTTGAGLIRAGVPRRWTVGDKTGTGTTYGVRNDIAVAWRLNKRPLVLAILSNRHEPEAEPDDRLIAEAARVVAAALR